MSYILDALKRAESERERGRVPGLHAQPVPATVPSPSDGLRPWVVPAALLLLACIAGFSIWWSRAASPAPAQPAPAVQPPSPPSSSTPALPAPIATPSPAAVPPAQVPAPIIEASREAAPASVPAPPAPKAPPPTAITPATAPLAATSPSAGVTPPIPSASELPPELRQQLPALAISGVTYSANAAHRMLIVNGQVFREGDKPAPDLTVEQIQPRAVVFSFRGQRYSVAY